MSVEEISIINLTHPDYNNDSINWGKYRKTYEGGPGFVRQFLVKYSNREDQNEYNRRKSITYCPSFAKMAINEIRNAICQRMSDVSRESGPKSFINAVAGLDGGVNMQGSSMNLFMGDKVIPDLLSIGKIGVFVDMPPIVGPTIADKGTDRPYLYTYKAEQIRSWSYDVRQPDKLIAVLLEDASYIYDEKTGLTTGTDITYRHLWLQDDKVSVTFYDTNGSTLLNKSTVLDLPQIPFIICELPESLLLDVCDYQIALLNLESSDLSYILKSNYPFYTEQYDARSESPYVKQSGLNAQSVFENRNQEPQITQDNAYEVEVGSSSGRRYPVTTERPGFIHPSSEPLQISMAKAEQLKKDIRALVHLAVINLAKDGDGVLEDGLSLIGSKIENLESRIGEIWSLYEGEKNTPSIQYPQTYSLKTEEERLKEATDLETLISKVPSKIYQKEIAKRIAKVTVGHHVPKYILEKIKDEIDSSEVVITDPNIIKIDMESGLVSTELASKIRGYPEGQVEQAKRDHEERVTRIAIAQSQGAGAEAVRNPDARGVSDLSGDPKGAQSEKAQSRDNTFKQTPTDATRGEGK